MSLDSVRCELCTQPRYFKNNKGLKIHVGRLHKITDNTVLPSNSFSSIPNSTPVVPLWETLSTLKKSTPLVRRIPRGSRHLVSSSLQKTISNVVSHNTSRSWELLLTFAYRTLHVDKSHSISLTQKIKNNCFQNDTNILNSSSPNVLPSTSIKHSYNVTKLIQNKIGDGDLKGAARLLFSSDTIAPDTAETLDALRSKHPSPSHNTSLPDTLNSNDLFFQATTNDVLGALMAFRSGSAAGLDGLSPQHYKDLVCGANVDAGGGLLKSITDLVNLMLSGRVPQEITQTLYGANLCALKKKDGGIRPIAVGSTIRRVVSKICCKKILPLISSTFIPSQLGFGVKGGCEAAVHAARTFLLSSREGVLLKIDVKNAFNSLDRGVLLSEVKDKIPHLFPYLAQCYREPSKLLYRNKVLSSAVGCQQGDPLGPAIFSLAIHPIISNLHSKFNVWYLDDGTLGGEVNTVLDDLNIIISKFKSFGLELNFDKCEIYVPNSFSAESKLYILEQFNNLAPGIKNLNDESLRLLGAPVLEASVPRFVDDSISKFNNISHRLLEINPHMALTIVRFCLFVPKFTYFLRCSPLWKFNTLLENLDSFIKDILTSVLNCPIRNHEWTQASLPIRYGGLGIRKISSVSLPAFLSSVYSTHSLYGKIISPSLGSIEVSYLAEARNEWSVVSPTLQPVALHSQRQWDDIICKKTFDTLLDQTSSQKDRARLLAVSAKESGYWLHALPSANLGTMLDPTTLSVVIGLRLGASINQPHLCHCGDSVDAFGHHGLSCSRSAGRFSRHSTLNDIIKRSLATAGVPAVLEPIGLVRSDGKRPDGMTIVPWKMGRSLVWDATCVDTLAASHIQATSSVAGAAATNAEQAKSRKYVNLDGSYIFVPFGVETLGPWGPGARKLFEEVSKRVIESTGDPRAGSYLGQRISLAIQRGNAASILGTMPRCGGIDEILDLI